MVIVLMNLPKIHVHIVVKSKIVEVIIHQLHIIASHPKKMCVVLDFVQLTLENLLVMNVTTKQIVEEVMIQNYVHLSKIIRVSLVSARRNLHQILVEHAQMNSTVEIMMVLQQLIVNQNWKTLVHPQQRPGVLNNLLKMVVGSVHLIQIVVEVTLLPFTA